MNPRSSGSQYAGAVHSGFASSSPPSKSGLSDGASNDASRVASSVASARASSDASVCASRVASAEASRRGGSSWSPVRAPHATRTAAMVSAENPKRRRRRMKLLDERSADYVLDHGVARAGDVVEIGDAE